MDWHAIEAITGVVCALATLISAYTALTVRAAIAKLREEAAELRAKEAESRARERDELKTWINGSFMRAKIVEAELGGMDSRIGRLEAEVWRAA